jgi:hypothetical protein
LTNASLFLFRQIAPAIAAAIPAAMYVGSKLAIPRDMKLAKGLASAKLGYRSFEKSDTINISYRFEENCKKHPNREALVFEGKSYTFLDIQRGKALICAKHLKELAFVADLRVATDA